ncbi:DNRLRE domain-containing protein [Clostridium rectalis]|uniref:DNRLRE domain-containing protein n=1 Tax=Clostridium rectalis TaxID=2040295 RepID=UPI000F6343CF|nr:DNRLRE domain-containing protein [Clostridium rectalis]
MDISTMEAEFEMTWYRNDGIDGNLEVTNQEDSLTGVIETKKTFSSTMESDFNVTWHEDTEINGVINTSEQSDIFKGNIEIYKQPKNKMEAELSSVLPERNTVELKTIKDTYVTELKPSLNYGKSSIMKVGTDKNNYVYRGLLEFKIPKDLQTMYITKTKLKLYSDDINSFKDLEISVPSKAWGEYNVVWYGQPSRKRVVKISDLPEGKYEHIIDITELVKDIWVLYPYENQGLILKSKDETIKQVKNFGTMESENPPKLEIEYFDKDLFLTTGSIIGGSVKVQRTGNADLYGGISVFRHSGESLIDGNIHVHNMNMLESKVNVAQFKNMNGVIKTQRLRSDVKGEIFSSKEKLHGTICSSACKDLYGYIQTMPNSNIDGLIDVKYKSQLYGSINKIRPLMEQNINSKIQVSDKNDMSGRLKVKYKSNILGDINVVPMKRKDLQSFIQVSDKNDILGRLEVKYKQDLNGQLKVMYVNDLEGYIRPTYKDISEMESLINTILRYDLQGSIRVNPVGFNGLVNVNAVNDLKCKINVNALSELYGNIKTNIKNDLDGCMKVQAMDIDDLNGLIIIGENSNIETGYIYAFIM